MNEFGRSLTEIAMAFIGVGAIALLVSHASGASQLTKAVGDTFNGLLQTVTLQNQFGNAFAP